MKSLLWSIIIMIIVFSALKLNIMVVMEGHALFYIAIIGFICVIGCALYFVGVPKKSDNTALINGQDNLPEANSKMNDPKPLEGGKKEQENEEK